MPEEEKRVRVAQMIYILIYKEHERPLERRGNRRGGTKKQVQPNYICRSVREEKNYLQGKRIN